MNPEELQGSIEFPHIASELQSMIDIDQAMREKSDQDENYWDYEVDAKNTERMKEIVAEIGFPTIPKVGQTGAGNAWLLIQHADQDVEFQTVCLGLMKEALPGEVEKRHIAFLEDRVRVNQNKEQLYGTQFIQKDNKHIPRPIEDEGNVNARRAEMGMDTLADQIKLMYTKYPFDKQK